MIDINQLKNSYETYLDNVFLFLFKGPLIANNIHINGLLVAEYDDYDQLYLNYNIRCYIHNQITYSELETEKFLLEKFNKHYNLTFNTTFDFIGNDYNKIYKKRYPHEK